VKASQNHVVTIEYRMVDEKANLIDSTDDTDPLSFIQGHGMVLPAIEREIEGRHSGERLTFRISPEDAFGQPDPARIRTIPLSQFPTDQTPYPGARFFVKKEDQDVAVTIVAVEQDQVTVDGNHPLAGIPLIVDLVITEVRPALQNELESGIIQTDESIFAHEES
jgi:FKBP-type peptidyl-prolyl cis-trans isomerase SlyD